MDETQKLEAEIRELTLAAGYKLCMLDIAKMGINNWSDAIAANRNFVEDRVKDFLSKRKEENHETLRG